MKVIKGDQTIFFDVDDTLVMWGIPGKAIQIDCHGTMETVVPNTKHIELLKEYAGKEGYTVVVWSQGGWEWAKAVVEALELEDYVDLAVNKPEFYVDDLNAVWFMNDRNRIYLEE